MFYQLLQKRNLYNCFQSKYCNVDSDGLVLELPCEAHRGQYLAQTHYSETARGSFLYKDAVLPEQGFPL